MTSSRILVVDDDDDIREMLAMALETNGYEVDTARDGLDALRHLDNKSPPALILLDLMMPRMDGEQFMRSYLASGRERAPVVIMSGHGATDEIATETHAEGALRKPIDLADLLSTVDRFCQR